jgi:hypothetical protein
MSGASEARLNDIVYRDEGTVILFTFLSEAARSFSEDHLGWASWQQLSPYVFAADRRPAIELIEMLREEGFQVMEVRS